MERLKRVRPVIAAYVMVVLFLLGLLVERRPPAPPAVPALAGASPAAGSDVPGPPGEEPSAWEREEPATGRPLWRQIFRPDPATARLLLSRAIPFFGRSAPRVVLYGSARPRTLFQALFPFLADPGRSRTAAEVPGPPGQAPPPGRAARPDEPGGRPPRTPGSPRAGAPGGGPPATSRNPPAARQDAGCRRTPDTPLVAGGVPLVGIYHTHDYESYISEFPGLKPRTDEDWQLVASSDPNRSVIRVGRQLAERLCERGITVVHSPSKNAYSYLGAYAYSRKTAQYILERFPTIQVLLDLHRDAIDKAATTVEIEGRPVARIAIVLGMGDSGLPQPRWQRNLQWAEALDRAMNERYPGLSRGILRRKQRYNQDLLDGALLLEVGSASNSMDEALRAADLFASVLADVIVQRQKEAAGADTGTGAAGPARSAAQAAASREYYAG